MEVKIMVDINYIKSIIYPEQESVDKRIEPGIL